MLIIADSSALIALAACDGLNVLLHVYDDIRVPQTVYDEVVKPEKSQAAALKTFLSGRVTEVDSTLWVLAAGGLGQGEIEAMALYKQLLADTLLIDDHRARIIAEHNHIHCIGRLAFYYWQNSKRRSKKLRHTYKSSGFHRYIMAKHCLRKYCCLPEKHKQLPMISDGQRPARKSSTPEFKPPSEEILRKAVAFTSPVQSDACPPAKRLRAERARQTSPVSRHPA